MIRGAVYPWTNWLTWVLALPCAAALACVALWAFTGIGDLAYDGLTFWWVLAGVPLVGLVALWDVSRRRRAVSRFADALAPALATQVQPGRQVARATLATFAVLCLALAIIGPRWGTYFEKLEAFGVDIVVALDVSRSMLAEDVRPNRLTRAKQEITRLTFTPSNRLGLLAFAGAASVKTPLTLDHAFFTNALDRIDVDSAPRGGTAIAEAIYTAEEFFAASPPNATRIILVLTDGEDHEGDPVLAAKDVWENSRAHVFVVGVGDPTLPAGATVPSRPGGPPMTYEGQIVYSKLDVEGMTQIAEVGKGMYVPVEAFRAVVDRIAQMDKEKLTGEERKRQRPRYQVFLAMALAALTLESLIAERRRKLVDVPVRLWSEAA
ncbi:MAG: VWA domain-containing protein [Phycisphaerales bacterium]|nr:MAG: VWA domain-containing protein [Phycisphaerales bacterium]